MACCCPWNSPVGTARASPPSAAPAALPFGMAGAGARCRSTQENRVTHRRTMCSHARPGKCATPVDQWMPPKRAAASPPNPFLAAGPPGPPSRPSAGATRANIMTHGVLFEHNEYVSECRRISPVACNPPNECTAKIRRHSDYDFFGSVRSRRPAGRCILPRTIFAGRAAGTHTGNSHSETLTVKINKKLII